jgi:multidrug efflux pump subunit AcrA (membrane-fusion protein)
LGRAVADKAATDKAAADKAAVDKAAADRAAAAKAATDKAASDEAAAAKAAANKAAAEKTAAAEQAAIDLARAETERAKAEAIEAQADVERPRPEAEKTSTETDAVLASTAAEARMSFIYGLISSPICFGLGGLVFLWVHRRRSRAGAPADALAPDHASGAGQREFDRLVTAVLAEAKRREAKLTEPVASGRDQWVDESVLH